MSIKHLMIFFCLRCIMKYKILLSLLFEPLHLVIIAIIIIKSRMGCMIVSAKTHVPVRFLIVRGRPVT